MYEGRTRYVNNGSIWIIWQFPEPYLLTWWLFIGAKSSEVGLPVAFLGELEIGWGGRQPLFEFGIESDPGGIFSLGDFASEIILLHIIRI